MLREHRSIWGETAALPAVSASSTTTTAEAATAASASTTTAKASAALAARGHGASFVHGESAAIKLFAIPQGNSGLGFFVGSHLDKPESA